MLGSFALWPRSLSMKRKSAGRVQHPRDCGFLEGGLGFRVCWVEGLGFMWFYIRVLGFRVWSFVDCLGLI